MERVALFFMRCLGWLVAVCPEGIRCRLAWGIGRILQLLGYRKEVITENIERAYPGEENRTIRLKLVRQAYTHFSQIVLELFVLLGPLKRYSEKNVKLLGKEHSDRALENGNGVIFLACHVGNWEFLLTTADRLSAPFTVVTKLLKPRWLHDAIEKARRTCGTVGTYEPKTMRDILRALKNNEFVGMILDQYAGPPVGIRVPFFGVPVGTSAAVATIAQRTGASVVPAFCHRNAQNEVIAEIHPEVPWIHDPDPKKAIAKNTAHYVSLIEGHLRKHPEQWLWTHRRFKGDLSPLRPEEWRSGRERSGIKQKSSQPSNSISDALDFR